MGHLLAAVVLIACACMCVHAGRMPSAPAIFDIPETLAFESEQASGANAAAASEVPATAYASSYAEGLEALLLTEGGPEGFLVDDGGATSSTSDNKRKAWPIRILTKFLVRPAIHGRFVQAFERLQEGGGPAHLSLSKIAGDNIVWSSYTVYEDFAALRRHIGSKAVRKFGEFILDNNIVAQHQLLIKVGGCRKNDLTCVDTPEVASELAGSHKPKPHPIRLVTAYVVAQERHRDFIQAWQELEAKLSKSKGSLALALHKPAGDNFLFLSYTAWKDAEAFWDAARSDASRQFIQYLGNDGVVAVTKKLWHVGCSKRAHRV